MVSGNDYRILHINGKIVDIIHREDITITGNGKDDIQKLIDNRNQKQKQNKGHKTHNITWSYIHSKGYNINSVLENGKKLEISKTKNFHNGANIVRIPLHKIPQSNLLLFNKVIDILGINFAGIDYMTSDITKPYLTSK